jgi:hypothetical protein
MALTSKLLSVSIIILGLSSCTAVSQFVDDLDKQPELTSPCVSAEDGPCGPKRYPDKQWLMNHQKLSVSA